VVKARILNRCIMEELISRVKPPYEVIKLGPVAYKEKPLVVLLVNGEYTLVLPWKYGDDPVGDFYRLVPEVKEEEKSDRKLLFFSAVVGVLCYVFFDYFMFN